MTRLVQIVRELPAATVTAELPHAATAFLDTIGCIAMGSREQSVTAIRRAVEELDGRQLEGLGPDRQSLVLGAAAHALDFDDVLEPANSHASAVLVPACLTMAAFDGADLRAAYDAFTAGYVVFYAIGRAMNPAHYLAGWHATSTLGVIASAAAASRLRDLGDRATANALSLATSLAAGPKQQFGYGAKHLHPGQAAAAGILAARMAECGLTGSPEVFTGDAGFVHLYRQGSLPELLDASTCWTKGTPSNQLWLKAYPSCASTHRPLAALTELIEEGAVGVGEPADLRVGLPEIARRSLRNRYPATPTEAKFSIEFCLSVLLLQGRIGLHDFSSARIADYAVRDQAGRITVVTDESLAVDGTQPERAEVLVTTSGTSVRRTAAFPPGHPQSPLSRELVLAKFRQAVTRVGGEAKELEQSVLGSGSWPATGPLQECLSWIR